MGTKKFTEQYFIFPANDAANESISKHTPANQSEYYESVVCFIGKNKKELPVFQMNEMIFNFFKRSKIGLYAFKQKTKESKKQFFYSQHLDKKNINPLAEEIEKLLKKTKK